MNKNDIKKEIRQALETLGYEKYENINIVMLDDVRAMVIQYQEGKPPWAVIGIYDFVKHTFVD